MNGTAALRRSVGGGVAEAAPVVTLVIYKDVAGYGMKVSGDNPVYVNSVKEGGAAARAGLHAGDKIIKVNGVNVMQSTHTDVVELIKSSTQVVLTVQQKPVGSNKSAAAAATSLQIGMAAGQQQHQRPASLSAAAAMVAPPSPQTSSATSLHRASTAPAGGALPCNTRITGPQPVDTTHRMPQTSTPKTRKHEKKRQLETQRVHTFQLMLEKEQSYVDKLRSDLAKAGAGYANNITAVQAELANAERRVRTLQDQLAAITNSEQFSQGANLSSANSLNKHQRTKSSPEQLGATMISPAEASRRLIASESMSDLSPPGHVISHNDNDMDERSHITPPGTPPPPYPAPSPGNDSTSPTLNDTHMNESIPGLLTIQQSIMSMEDDDMSDQEVGQLEDHGPFKSLTRLKEHHGHLAVFINYVLSNSDPSSLLFYLITDLYRDGNAKEMRKWAYEIHSSFLVPGAPLRLHNVDECVVREIDDVLSHESDKEEILRTIFVKARTRANKELNEQLADFQQKRTAGLGTLFGPCDAQLDESVNDKTRETKIIETFLLPKMEPFLEDIEKENVELRQFTIAAGLATILTKIFQVRPVSLERVPTFVAKDKSNIRARLLTGKTRKMTIRGHHFLAQQYFTVTYCNHCQLIIGGISPQGYQCSDCILSVHRQCVRVVDENCLGPLVRKEKGDRISKLMEKIRPERKPPSSHHHSQNHMHHIERIKRSEEESAVLTDGENGDHRGGGITGNSRSNSERGRISAYGSGDHADSMDDPSSREDISEMVQQNISNKPKTSNINRSESYKERIHHKRQLREKRKTSDPNLSKTNDCGEPPGSFPGNSAGSSSNSSLSTRSLDSPSTSLEQVHPTAGAANASTSWDSDVDVEPDPPEWSVGVPEEVLARLSVAEKKRQEVINELFHTERSHVRALRVLSYVFHKPLLESQVLPLDQIQLLFSNLDEMVTIHSRFNQAMKCKKKENPCVGDVSDLLLEMFDGDTGEAFERAASIYCAKQQVALDALRERRKKDPKLNAFLNDVEANPLCRRLQLKDHILTGMLRLTKYPLLFEKLVKYTSENNEKERAAVLRSLERSKEIVSRVNQAVREAEDYQRLAEIQRTIDRSAFDKFDHPTVQEFKNLDITKRKLIYEGPLQWRRTEQNRAKPVDLHVVLLDDTIFLLHRQDEKYLLKFINTSQANSVLSPIVKVSTVLVRHNAVDKNSLYLVNTSQNQAQIYDLVAASPAERILWCKHISEAAEAYKSRDRHGRRSTPSTTLPEEPIPTIEESSTEPDHISEKAEQEPDKDIVDDSANIENEEAAAEASTPESSAPEPSVPQQSSPQQRLQQQPAQAESPGGGAMADSLRITTCTQFVLADPVEVHAEVPPVHIAEPILTPMECLRRKDEVIKKALEEKQLLVADILNIPKEDFEQVADIAAEPSSVEKEPAELILAAINQANQLAAMLNSALNVTEIESVLVSRGSSSTPVSPACEATGCPVPRSHSLPTQPLVPVASIQPVCHSLTSQLSQLLEVIKKIEDERDKLRKELRRSRERLHALDSDAQRREFSDAPTTTMYTQTEPGETTHKESCTDDLNNEEFVDARGDTDIDNIVERVQVDGEIAVMGDSVG
ncbi:rho guanine nucleotide exchange factor 12-like isoform X2 [Prorops nasuta]|uniref:rho guanine nucleotide exchange factor 12-like isoform X2 n=1 Tax=Prorops nasuta TaxID=863751 RepID=UPI0034CDB936